MNEYLFAYHAGPDFENQENGAEKQGAFMAWIAELGEAVVNPGTPLVEQKTVESDGSVRSGVAPYLTGFSIIKAENSERALEIAQSCPFLDVGSVEVAKVVSMG